MDITKQMDEQLKIDDHKYALEMLPAMPKPIQRYIDRLLTEHLEYTRRRLEDILDLQKENDALYERAQRAESLAGYYKERWSFHMTESERLRLLVERFKPDPNSPLSMLSWNELYQAYKEREEDTWDYNGKKKENEELYKTWIRDLEQQIQEMRDEYDELSLSYQKLEITYQEDRAQITKYENQIEHMQRITTNQADTISELLTRIEEFENENRRLSYYDLKQAWKNRGQL